MSENTNGSGHKIFLARPVMTSVPGEIRAYRSKEDALKNFGGDPSAWERADEPGVWETDQAPMWERDSHESWILETVTLRGVEKSAVVVQEPPVVQNTQQKTNQQRPPAAQGKGPTPGNKGA